MHAYTHCMLCACIFIYIYKLYMYKPQGDCRIQGLLAFPGYLGSCFPPSQVLHAVCFPRYWPKSNMPKSSYKFWNQAESQFDHILVLVKGADTVSYIVLESPDKNKDFYNKKVTWFQFIATRAWWMSLKGNLRWYWLQIARDTYLEQLV